MSDLAAFVAATIESKVVEDLKDENDTLRAEISKTRASALQSAKRGGCIEITGEGGSPMYAHGLLHTAEEDDPMQEGVREYELKFTSNTQAMCQISKVLDAEIRVNGIKVSTVGECNSVDSPSGVGDTEQCLIYIFETGCGTHWKGFMLGLKFGPVPPLGSFSVYPEDMKDEDIEEVVFEDFLISIDEEGNEDDFCCKLYRS